MNTQILTRLQQPVMVQLSQTGSYQNGVYHEAPWITHNLKMVVVPETELEMKYLDSGYMETQTFKFYDSLPVIEIKNSDLIIVNSRTYEVFKVMNRSKQGFKIYYGKLQS